MLVANPQNLYDVTYKEVMQLWNSTEKNAKHRLTRIRKSLNKQRWQKITILQYCREEDISVEEFYHQLVS